MAVTNLKNTGTSIDTGNDSIVIVQVLDTVRGGRSLNVTGFTPEVIKAGHVIIKEDATGDHKPMPISGSAYAALPGGHSYVGVLIASILKTKPMAAIMTQGTVNDAAGPYPIGPILTAFKAANPLIDFRRD